MKYIHSSVNAEVSEANVWMMICWKTGDQRCSCCSWRILLQMLLKTRSSLLPASKMSPRRWVNFLDRKSFMGVSWEFHGSFMGFPLIFPRRQEEFHEFHGISPSFSPWQISPNHHHSSAITECVYGICIQDVACDAACRSSQVGNRSNIGLTLIFIFFG